MENKFSWLSVLDLHYANSIFLYGKIDGFGEKIRSFGLMFFHSFGFAIFIVNVIGLFSWPIAPVVRQYIPYLGRSYDNAAEYALAFPIAMIVNYLLYWRRHEVIIASHGWLEGAPIRWLVGVGGALGILFFVANGLGRYNFQLSVVSSIAVLAIHAAIWRIVVMRHV